TVRWNFWDRYAAVLTTIVLAPPPAFDGRTAYTFLRGRGLLAWMALRTVFTMAGIDSGNSSVKGIELCRCWYGAIAVVNPTTAILAFARICSYRARALSGSETSMNATSMVSEFRAVDSW